MNVSPDSTTPRGFALSSVRFQCSGRTGYFGDEDFDCRVFHFCGEDDKRTTFRCGGERRFDEVRRGGRRFDEVRRIRGPPSDVGGRGGLMR